MNKLTDTLMQYCQTANPWLYKVTLSETIHDMLVYMYLIALQWVICYIIRWERCLGIPCYSFLGLEIVPVFWM